LKDNDAFESMMMENYNELTKIKQSAQTRAKASVNQIQTQMSAEILEQTGWSAEKWEEETAKVYYEVALEAKKLQSKP